MVGISAGAVPGGVHPLVNKPRARVFRFDPFFLETWVSRVRPFACFNALEGKETARTRTVKSLQLAGLAEWCAGGTLATTPRRTPTAFQTDSVLEIRPAAAVFPVS